MLPFPSSTAVDLQGFLSCRAGAPPRRCLCVSPRLRGRKGCSERPSQVSGHSEGGDKSEQMAESMGYSGAQLVSGCHIRRRPEGHQVLASLTFRPSASREHLGLLSGTTDCSTLPLAGPAQMAQWGPDAVPPCGKQCFSDQLKLCCAEEPGRLPWPLVGAAGLSLMAARRQPEGFGEKPAAHHWLLPSFLYPAAGLLPAGKREPARLAKYQRLVEETGVPSLP